MPLFEEGPRIELRPPAPKETAFAYLNRRAGAEADDARGRIEDWLVRYPEPAARVVRIADLRGFELGRLLTRWIGEERDALPAPLNP